MDKNREKEFEDCFNSEQKDSGKKGNQEPNKNYQEEQRKGVCDDSSPWYVLNEKTLKEDLLETRQINCICQYKYDINV